MKHPQAREPRRTTSTRWSAAGEESCPTECHERQRHTECAYYFGTKNRVSATVRQYVAFVMLHHVQPAPTDRDAPRQTVVIPDRRNWEAFEFFEESQPRGEVALQFKPAEEIRRFEQGCQQRTQQTAGTDDPGGHPVDAGVEEIEPQVDPIEVTAANHFLCDRGQIIGESHHVVAVPADTPAQVEQYLRHPQKSRGDLVRDPLGRMEVPSVQAENLAVVDRVAEVELMRPDNVGLGPEPEELRLDGVFVEARVNGFGENRVERFHQSLAWGFSVRRSVLVSVRNPDVRHACLAGAFAKVRTHAAARDSMFDPEPADTRIGVGKSESVGRQWVREVGGVEVEAEFLFARPVGPAAEVLGADLVAFDLAVGLQITRMQIEP